MGQSEPSQFWHMRAKLMHSSAMEELETQYRACPILQSCSAVHPHEVSIERHTGKDEEELSIWNSEE